MKKTEKNEIIRSDFNNVAFELFEKLLDGDQNFSPIRYF